MLWLLAQLVMSSLPEVYPITLETLNWCAPALGSVLVSMAVLWMVFLRHYITGPETGESCVPAWLTPKLPGVSQRFAVANGPRKSPCVLNISP